ncbi:hypothetical protein DB31_3451 [Hyalangium minutum]|uniref:Uncharacterized protein n=1 Tax=Hyalangium minutum TaxID=394096 RepID=A0A085WUF8_9BACT|nr:hypothetical protein DB31_3451 [Hyalangium minutum]
MPWWLMAVLVGACASSAPSERPVGPPPKVLFQSPLALLLEHHTELELTTEQLIELDRREAALQEKNRPLREKLQMGRGRDPEQGEAPPPGGGISGGRGDPSGMRGHGMGGMGGRGMGGRGGRGSGMGGGPRREGAPEGEEALKQRQAVLREMEDNESAAYNDAEPLLNEEQKAKARELVSRQREERIRIRDEGPAGRARP